MTDDPEKYFKMDKKNSFPSFAPNANKNISLDSNPKATVYARQDGTSGSQISKVQQRTPSRYRGNVSGSGNNARSESNSRNKQCLPRGRGNFDKRGKPKGVPPATSEAVAKVQQHGSLQSSGGKKQQNLDDLWGFHFAPRSSRDRGYEFTNNVRSHPPGGGHWRQNYLAGPNRVKYAKDYLLANCQFLVRLGEDYTVYMADPDLLVAWDLIEQVRIRFDGEMPKCPICLDFPVAAKITKCGHIYCWSCFLHYLALSDNKIRTCPICYEPVSRKDLKSVLLLPQEEIQVKTKIEMRLMVRLKDSLVACPFEKFAGWETKFCKILQIAPEAIVYNILNRERAELDFAFCSDPNAPEVCFIEEALQELVAREIALTAKQVEFMGIDPSSNGLFPPSVVVPVGIAGGEGARMTVEEPEAIRKDNIKQKTRTESMSSNSSGGGGVEDPIQAAKQIDANGNCYFYQISDGRNVFLHPMNMAMLWRELGPDPEKWPQLLTFEVIDIESKSATDEMRKRMKLVRHLPKNAPVDLVEVSMEEWGISPEVYKDFSTQIKQREQRRRNRAKEERIFEKKQRERDEMEMNKLRQMPMIASPQEFPAFAAASFGPGLSTFTEEVLGLDGAIEPEAETHLEGNLSVDVYSATSSFAQIAGKAPIKRSPTIPLATRSIWGSTPQAPATTTRQSDSENDGEDYIPVPNYRASVSDAIERAMAGLAFKNEAPEPERVTSPQAGNKKKKNKKGTVLFATGMGPFN